jgi:hypothetical protein
MLPIRMREVPKVSGQPAYPTGTPIHIDKSGRYMTYAKGTPYFKCLCGGFQTANVPDPTCNRCYERNMTMKVSTYGN